MSDAATALSAQAARLAGALADLLETLSDGALGDACAFLRRMRDDHAGTVEDAEPFTRLAEALGLSPLERDLVLLAGLPEEHEGYTGVLRRLHPDGEPRATVALAAQLLCPTPASRHDLRATLATGPAVEHGLLSVGGEGPLPDRTLALPDGLWTELAGLTEDAPRGVSAGLHVWLTEPAVARAAHALAAGERCSIVVVGENAEAAHERALALVAAAGRAALAGEGHDATAAGRRALAGEGIAAADATVTGLRALARDAVPVLVLHPREPGQPPALAPLAEHPGAVVFSAAPGAAARHGDRPLLTLRIEPLDVRARRELWLQLLPELAAEAGELASSHLLEPGLAARIATDVRCARAALDGRPPEPADVAAATRGRSSGALPAGIVVRRPSRAGTTSSSRPTGSPSCARPSSGCVTRGACSTSGASSRGRPRRARRARAASPARPAPARRSSAEVLARALGVDLLVVDISRVVSKWIGETEKNLAEVFDAAERAQARPAVRRGRLAVRQAHRGHGRARPLREPRDDLPAAAPRALRRPRDPRRRTCANNIDAGVHAPARVRASSSTEPSRDEREALWRCHLPARAPLADDVDLGELAALLPGRRRPHPQRRGRRRRSSPPPTTDRSLATICARRPARVRQGRARLPGPPG